MIKIEHLVKNYGPNCAVDDISFEVKKGEIVGFLGPNGAGKSTTMNILTGYLSMTSGSVSIAGLDVLDNPLEAKKHIGYLPEQPPLYTDMTVEEYLSFMYDLKKVKLNKVSHINEVCEITKITDVKGRIIGNLSKGYRQRVGIAQALLGNPPVLILDEPTVGLDPKQIIEIRTLIKNLGKKHTVILSSHILPEVQAVCERILVINKGKLVADGTADRLAHDLSSEHKLIARIEAPEKELVMALKALARVIDVVCYGEKEPGVFEVSIEATPGSDIRRDLFAMLTRRGWPILSLRNTDLTLEEVFIQLINGDAVLINQDSEDSIIEKGAEE